MTFSSSTLLPQIDHLYLQPPPPAPPWEGATYTVKATGGGSGNPVVFSIASASSSVCSISGAVVSFTGAGTCTIDANQAGNSTYNAAPQAQQSFTVSSASSAPPDDHLYLQPPHQRHRGRGHLHREGHRRRLGQPGRVQHRLRVELGVLHIWRRRELHRAGTCTIDANQAGNSTYNAAPQAQQSFTVSSRTTGFAYSQTLTVNNSNSTALTNFQVKVSLTSSNFDFAEAQSAGQDLRFYASDGATALNFWTESYSSSAQTATIWVEVPSIPADGSTTIVMKWGNSTATTRFERHGYLPALRQLLRRRHQLVHMDGIGWHLDGRQHHPTQRLDRPGGRGDDDESPFKILESTYKTGSSYVLDAYGQQVSGRVWGLGVGVTDAKDLDSINLYDDLNGSDNLYMYKWTSANALGHPIADAAVGTVNANQWYDMTAKVAGTAISVYLNGTLEAQGTDSALTAGSVALYGEAGTEEFSDVFVRQYAATDPTVTF